MPSFSNLEKEFKKQKKAKLQKVGLFIVVPAQWSGVCIESLHVSKRASRSHSSKSFDLAGIIHVSSAKKIIGPGTGTVYSNEIAPT